MKFVQQEKPVTTKHEKLGDISFNVEVAEVETQEEMIQDAGGIDALILFYNGQKATNAKNAARAYARNFEVADGADPATYETLKAQIATKGQQLARDYSPSTDTERGPSKAKKAAAFDSVAALVNSGKEFTREELMALLGAVK